MFKINLGNPIKVYFIGIGGISMSGLAKILADRGFSVEGTDRAPSEQTEDLENFGIKVNFGHSAENITEDIDLVVYTAAISGDNPELNRAKELNIPILTRAELLGEIMENYKESITICGTHGKTTTTSMATLILMEHADPTATIGGVLPAIKSNVRIGGDEFFVAEACEYTNSFFSFFPKYNVILNIEEDHPDFFANLLEIRKSFRTFAENTKEGGSIFINTEIENYEEIVTGLNVSVHTFGLSKDSELYAKDIDISKGKSSFTPVYKGSELSKVSLNVPGIYNVVNALGAISLSLDLGIPMETIVSGLKKFTGAHRRFEYKGEVKGATIIDDYAHHPTEVAACIGAAKEYEPSRLIVAFQPHTYTRTEALFEDFVRVLSKADMVVLTEIYAAREKNVNNTSSKDLVEALKNKGSLAYFTPTNKDAKEFLYKNLVHGDMLIIMGAGDIYLLNDLMLEG